MKKNILLFIFGLIFLISSQYTAASCYPRCGGEISFNCWNESLMVYARYNMTHHSMEDTIICQNFSEYSGNSPASIPSKRGLFDSNATNPQGYSTKYHMNISDSSNIKTMTDFSVLVLANVTATPTLTDLSILASSSCDSNRGGMYWR